MSSYQDFINWLHKQEEIVFYGAGYIAEKIFALLEAMNMWNKVNRVFVTGTPAVNSFHDKEVVSFSKGKVDVQKTVLLAVSERFQNEIKEELEKAKVKNYVSISDSLIAEIDIRLNVDNEIKQIAGYAKENECKAKEDILFLSPPYWDVYSPFSAVPCLVAKLAEEGYYAKQVDLGIHCIRHLIKEKWKLIAERCSSKEFYKLHFEEYIKNEYVSYDEYEEGLWFFQADEFDIERIKASYESMNSVQKRVIDEFYNIAYYMETTGIDFDRCESLEEIIYSNNIIEFLKHLTQTSLIDIFTELPEVVGISITSTCQFIPGYLLAKLIKLCKPDTTIILGGSCADLFVKSDYKNKQDINRYFDYVIVGEGETAISGLMRYIKSGKQGGLENIPNLILFDEQGEIVYTEQIVESVRELPLANYEGLDLNLYLAPRVILPYQTSRGCHYGQCAFCDHDEKYRHNYRSKDMKVVVEDLLKLARKYQVCHFQFVDEAIRPDCFVEMVEEMDKHPEFRDIKWFYYSRVSRLYTKEILDKAQRNGCRMVMFGVETFNQRLLKHIKKGISAETSKHCLKLFHECGIKTYSWLLCNLPSETLEEAREDMEQVKALNEVMDGINVNLFCLFRNTDMYSNPEAYNITFVNEKDVLRFQSHYEGQIVDKEAMLEFYEKEYRKYQWNKFSVGNRYTLFFEE